VNNVASRAQIYPIPPDDQLTDDLVGLVADLLTFHGYPFIDGADLDRLRDALQRFLYGPAWCPGAPAGSAGECMRPGPHRPHMITTTPVTELCEIEDTGWCTVHEGFHPGRVRPRDRAPARPGHREQAQGDRLAGDYALVEVLRDWSI
jgi:hypothetical protein